MAETISIDFNITREQLAAFVKDPRTVRDLEAFLRTVREEVPAVVAVKVDETRAINTTAGQLTGGGTLAADRTLGLADTAVVAGVYGDSSNYSVFTVDEFGRLTHAAEIPLPTASGLLDVISSTRGSVLYRGASGWVALAPGTSGQFLKTLGAGADPLWAVASGGGANTPTVRSSSCSLVNNTNSIVVTWPTGTIAGDVVVLQTAHGWVPTLPTGWTQLDATNGTNVNGAMYGKVMTSADITAGNVTLGFSNSFYGAVAAVTITGSTVFQYVTKGLTQSGSGATSASETLAAGSLSTDLLICFATTRGISTACTVTSSGATSLATLTNANWSAGVYSVTGLSGIFGATVTNTFGSSGTGYYVGAVAFR